jgi:HEAT repeat protein
MQTELKMSWSDLRYPKARALRTCALVLIVAAACCGILFWSVRYLSHWPTIAASRGLKAQSVLDRVDATRLLVQVGIRDGDIAIPALIAALNDPDTEVRDAAAQALIPIVLEAVQSGSADGAVRAATAAMVRSLKDPQPVVRTTAATALGSFAFPKRSVEVIAYPPMVAALSTMLNDRDDDVRLAAVHALAFAGPVSQISPPDDLVAALQDQSVPVRAAAVEALAKFPCSLDPWLPFFIRSMEEDESQVRVACARAFYRRQPPAFSMAAVPALIAALKSRERIVRAQATRALYPHAHDPVAETAIPALLVLLREPILTDQTDPRLSAVLKVDPSEEAAFLLGEIAPGTASADEVIKALTDVVQSGHPVRGMRAVQSLESFGAVAESSTPVLIKAMLEASGTGDQFFFVARSVPSALGRIAPGKASAAKSVAALTDAARHSQSSDVRVAAIKALTLFGPDAATAIPVVRALREDPSLAVQSAAAAALGLLEREKSGPAN